jgi:hypothetical protein
MSEDQRYGERTLTPDIAQRLLARAAELASCPDRDRTRRTRARR